MTHTTPTTDLRDLATKDFFSLMNGSPHLGVSPADRIKLDWANIQFEDVNSFATRTVNLEDMWTSSSAPDVLWLTDGPSASCGDIVIEARKRTFYSDKTPVAGGYDGDGDDFFLPNEGLLVLRGPDGCDGYLQYSSIPNSRLYDRWKYFGTTGTYPAFGPGGAYTPQFVSSLGYDFWDNPSLDSRVAITDIQDTGTGFSFTVHSDYQGAVASFEASADTYIDKVSSTSNFGAATSILVAAPEPPATGPAGLAGFNEVRHGLLKWNLTSIPPGSVIHGVRLRIDVEDETSPTGYGVFEMKRP